MCYFWEIRLGWRIVRIRDWGLLTFRLKLLLYIVFHTAVVNSQAFNQTYIKLIFVNFCQISLM